MKLIAILAVIFCVAASRATPVVLVSDQSGLRYDSLTSLPFVLSANQRALSRPRRWDPRSGRGQRRPLPDLDEGEPDRGLRNCVQ